MIQENPSGDRSVAEQIGGTESLPLLATRLHRPPVTPDLEPRTSEPAKRCEPKV